jgi:hypothetical protein
VFPKTETGRVATVALSLAQPGATADARLLTSTVALRSARLTTIGHLVRRDLPAGLVKLKIPISRPAQRVLARRKHLRLTLNVSITRPGGAANLPITGILELRYS